MYTDEELRKFDRLTHNTASRDGGVRVSARIDMNAFVKLHGKEKCDAMWAFIKKRDGIKS